MNITNNFILVSVLSLASCGSISIKQKSTGTFPVTSPIYIDTLYTTDYVADINSVQNIELRARVKGYIEGIYVDEGQFVHSGQILFKIGGQLYKEELLKANAMVKSAIADAKAAELDVQSISILVEKKIVSESQLEMAKAKLEALNAKIEEVQSYEASARQRLSFTEIKAPFDGFINRIPYKIGSLIDEGTLLTSLSDNSEVFAYFHISEREYLDFAVHLKDSSRRNDVSLLLANNTVHPYKGSIETIEGEFDNSTGSIALRARFPNKERILKHGSSGKVRIERVVKHALVIPQKSTFEIQDRMFVFVVDTNGIVKMTAIVPQQRIAHLYAVRSGLTQHDRIIYEGIQDVKDGMKINGAPTSMREILKELHRQ
ncbi:MAG: efflux RND transporter periplasmic adaptor subunit [Bacteroidia bacterium]|nr:efflux RND transporter periplasmic adaptor subunit [Bacteroidia bacterium]